MSKSFEHEILLPGADEFETITGPIDEFTGPGSVYRTEDWESLDNLVRFLGQGIASRSTDTETIRFGYTPSIGEWIKAKVQREGYIGKLSPENAVILTPPPPSFLNNKNVRLSYNFRGPRRSLAAKDTVRLMVITRMDSTGRPNYGQVLSQATLYLNEAYETQDSVTSNPVFRAHGIASMEQRKRRGVLGIDELLAESKGNWEELMRIAIKFPFQGGRFSSR